MSAWLNEGSRPTAKVETPIRLMVARKVALRPMRSPMRPKIRAPMGRKANPTAKAPSAKM